jgi:hypothetical protein
MTPANFDGLTVPQAAALDGIMTERDPLIVIDIVVPEAELVRRLGTRMICEDCGTNADGHEATPGRCGKCGGRLVQRADDSDAVVLERFKIYQRATKPLVEFYRARSTFRTIDGAQAADSVAADLSAAILSADQSTEAGIGVQRARVSALRRELSDRSDAKATRLLGLADAVRERVG